MTGHNDERAPEAEPAADGDRPLPGDAFGACLLACWGDGARPGSVLELIERDEAFLDGGDAARYCAPPEELRPLLAGTPWRLERVEPAAAGPGYLAVLRCER